MPRFWILACFIYFSPGLLLSVSAQLSEGIQLPVVNLLEEEGQKTAWEIPPSGTTPVLVAYIHPDKEISLEALSGQLANASISPTTYQRLLIYNTSASWKPDRLIVWGHKLKKIGHTIAGARDEGIVQALLVKPQPSHNQWTSIYDREATLIRSWKLPQEDVHVFLFSPDRHLIYYCKGPLTNKKALTISQRLQQLVTSQG